MIQEINRYPVGDTSAKITLTAFLPTSAQWPHPEFS